jgi:hypothetical protein
MLNKSAVRSGPVLNEGKGFVRRQLASVEARRASGGERIRN